MNVDVPLLRKMVEWVEEQDRLDEGREWYQGWWVSSPCEPEFCDTAYCLAGKVVVMHGWTPDWSASAEDTVMVIKNGQREFVSKVAADILGLYGDQATRLFHGTNTAADIRRIAEDIAGEPL